MGLETSLTSKTWNPFDGSTYVNTDQIEFDYSTLGFTSSAGDSYKSTSGDVFKVYVDGVRIYRTDDATYASGTGFLEDGETATTLNGVSATWSNTSNTVWTIDTANQNIIIDTGEILATALYKVAASGGLYSSGAGNSDIVFNSSSIIEVRRSSQNEGSPSVDFSNASILTEQDLDNSSLNVFHMAQQAIVTAEKALAYNVGTGVYEAFQPGTTTKKRITQVASPTANDDAVTKTYLEDTWLTSTDKTNSATVAGISDEVETVAGDSTELTTLINGTDGTSGTGGTTKNIALVNTVALRTAEVGLLGTSAMATASTGHLARLGTADVVTDMGLLGATGVIDDMALLGADGVIEDMAQLTATGVIADMALLAGDSASGNTVIEDMNTLATSAIVVDLNLLATTDIVADLAAVTATGVIDDLETVANNVGAVNNFADTYQIDDFSPSAPTTDGGGNAIAVGDLAFDTTANQMKVYDGSSFAVMGLTQANATTTANNAAVAMSIALG